MMRVLALVGALLIQGALCSEEVKVSFPFPLPAGCVGIAS